MSYGKLNIWLRFEDCCVIKTCWKQVLVIKTCTGEYLTDIFPEVLEDVKRDYKNYKPEITNDYEGTTGIIFHGDGGKNRINHIEVRVPPGCYVVQSWLCINVDKVHDPVHYHGHNGWTNKVLVMVNCGQDVCVNLLVNFTKTCIREVLYPALVLAQEKRIPIEHQKVIADVLGKLMDVPQEYFKNTVKLRDAEYSDKDKVPEAEFHVRATDIFRNISIKK